MNLHVADDNPFLVGHPSANKTADQRVCHLPAAHKANRR